jgi:hypothetical protein
MNRRRGGHSNREKGHGADSDPRAPCTVANRGEIREFSTFVASNAGLLELTHHSYPSTMIRSPFPFPTLEREPLLTKLFALRW